MEAWPCGGVSMEMEHKRQAGLVNSFTTTIYEQSSAVCSDAKENSLKLENSHHMSLGPILAKSFFQQWKHDMYWIYMRFGNKEMTSI